MQLKPDEQLDSWKDNHGYGHNNDEYHIVRRKCFTCDGRGKSTWTDGEDGSEE